MLEWRGLEEWVGVERARAVMEFKRADDYRQVYAIVMDHRQQMEACSNDTAWSGEGDGSRKWRLPRCLLSNPSSIRRVQIRASLISCAAWGCRSDRYICDIFESTFLPFMVIDPDILSAEYLYSTEEILDEFQRRCEEAAETHSIERVTEIAPDVCRVLDRECQKQNSLTWATLQGENK
jgi:hypothetical protein